MQKQQIDVVAGVIYKEDNILICRRKPGKHQAGLWEFPGGKIEKDENHQEALIREIKEELQINISPKEIITKVIHEYAHAVIVLWVYKTQFLEGNITLTDHDKTLWVSAEELINFELAPADQPVISFLI
ncbi:(deoxy)nucleoside triphosphate pyrophosphohydrolase [Chondrinema litorale]|uniref:(deoxy)nucleoside triphosphate pyrophosphohydrolase n=1 Tax=Chondrinema litorale TaxID=2994555 RepID=UPI00254286EC|nr:(deoxy)nucleoside triphosphate pyrophosphohydrolase [Chondrinema litorale]UZR94066.1 (deoxy)nucleoside triphosphate pyrophosphohydrolase [Chondrinema litorale]